MAFVEAISMHLCNAVLPTVTALWTRLSRSVIARGTTDDKSSPPRSSNVIGTESMATSQLFNVSWLPTQMGDNTHMVLHSKKMNDTSVTHGDVHRTMDTYQTMGCKLWKQRPTCGWPSKCINCSHVTTRPWEANYGYKVQHAAGHQKCINCSHVTHDKSVHIGACRLMMNLLRCVTGDYFSTLENERKM